MPVVLNYEVEDGYNQTRIFNLEGKVYKFNIYYNYRSGWFLGIYNSSNIALIEGVRLMPNTSLLKDTDIFEGSLLCGSVTNPTNGEEVGLDNFGKGKEYELYYVPLQEVIEATEFVLLSE